MPNGRRPCSAGAPLSRPLPAPPSPCGPAAAASTNIRAGLAGAWTSHLLDFAGVLLFYLVFLLGVGVLKRYFLDRGLWAAVAASTTVVNLAAADRVQAAGEAAGSLGEGLADALDVGAI